MIRDQNKNTKEIQKVFVSVEYLLQIKDVYRNLIYSNMASTVGSYLMGKASFEFFSPEFADDDNTVAKVDVLLPRPKNGRPIIEDSL